MPQVKRLTETYPAALILIRLLFAFASGWLFRFLLFRDVQDPLLFFSSCWLPLCLAIIPAMTVGRRNKHRITLAVGTGLLALMGIYTYELPLVMQEDAVTNAYCAHNYCHVSGGLNTFVLTFGLFASSILVILGSVITILVMKLFTRLPMK
jgi:hypothetical protein